MKLKKLTAFAMAAVFGFSVAGFSASAETSSTEGAYTAPQLSVDLSSHIDENGFIKGADLDAVDLVDYKNMVIPTENHMPATETLNAYIVAQLPQVDSTEGTVALGDTVNIDYTGYVDEVPFEGGSATGYDLTLGSGAFIPGFEDQVAGHSVGENFDIFVTFPENYHADLAGKDARFNIYINSYKKSVAIEDVTDEMVAENLSALGVSTVEELNQYAIDDLSYTMVGNYIYTEIFEKSTLENVPQAAIDMQGDYLLASLELQAMNYGMDLTSMLQMYGYADAEEFKTMNADTIKAAAREICINQAIAKQEGFKVTDADISEYFGGQDYSVAEQVYGKPFLKFLIMQSNTLEWLINETPREGVEKAGTDSTAIILVVVLVAAVAAVAFFLMKNKKAVAETAQTAVKEIKEEAAELKADIAEEVAEIKAEIAEEAAEIKAEIKEEAAEIKAEIKEELGE